MGGAPNQNRLAVSWARQAGATGYKVYISTKNSTAGLSPAATVSGGDTSSIDSIPNYTALPDGTDYYVWIKAFNASGETQFSPASQRRTSDPIEAFFYTGNTDDFNKYYPESKDAAGLAWDSETDYYTIVPNPDGSGVHLFYGGFGGSYGEDSKILYHARFDAAEAERLTRTAEGRVGHSTYGKGSTSDQLLLELVEGQTDGSIGHSGVFIIRTSSPANHFYAVYYWGLGARQKNYTFGIAATQHSRNLLAYFSNAAAGAAVAGNTFVSNPPAGVTMYSSTFEHALGNYTVKTFINHIAWVAVPFYRRQIQYGGSKDGQHGGDSNVGWVSR